MQANFARKPYDLNAALRETIALILAGGRGSRLMNLTDSEAKPAVPFGGKFRIIDFPLSNCVNSGIRRIAVPTQYRAHTLIQHIQRGWNFLAPELGEYVEVWPAQQQTREESWYRGTADAVYQNLDLVRARNPRYVLILAGDHVYKQDYSIILAQHIERGATVTVSCVDVPLDDARAFGVVGVDTTDRITDFVEKPNEPPSVPDQPDRAFASMGIYLFDADLLYHHLERDAHLAGSSRDFGKDLIPYLVADGAPIYAHRFRDSCVTCTGQKPYWRDVGTVDAFWEANIDLTSVWPELDLYDPRWPILSLQEQRPSAKFVFDDDDRRGLALDSVVSAGCIVSGGTVRRSLLFNNVRVNSYTLVEDSVVLPNAEIGRRARLRKVLLDRDCRIPEGLVIGENPDWDAEHFLRTPKGVVLVTQPMLDALPG